MHQLADISNGTDHERAALNILQPIVKRQPPENCKNVMTRTDGEYSLQFCTKNFQPVLFGENVAIKRVMKKVVLGWMRAGRLGLDFGYYVKADKLKSVSK